MTITCLSRSGLEIMYHALFSNFLRRYSYKVLLALQDLIQIVLKAFHMCDCFQLIEANYGLGVKAEEAGDGGTADRHFKLIEAVLKVYDSWMNLVPLFKLKEAGVLQVCNGLSRRSRFEPGIIIVLEKVGATSGDVVHAAGWDFVWHSS